MTKYLKKCSVCSKYTISDLNCPYCSAPTKNPHPPKFSITDHYGKYRRKLKKIIAEEN